MEVGNGQRMTAPAVGVVGQIRLPQIPQAGEKTQRGDLGPIHLAYELLSSIVIVILLSSSLHFTLVEDISLSSCFPSAFPHRTNASPLHLSKPVNCSQWGVISYIYCIII